MIMMPSNYSEADLSASQLVKCVERALSHYGGTTIQVVFWNFEAKFNIQKGIFQNTPRNLWNRLKRCLELEPERSRKRSSRK